MRIAFLANPESVNGMYRATFPMAELSRRGHDVQRINGVGTSGMPRSALERFDVLHVHRYCDERVQRLMRQAQACGVAVVWDDDDDAGSNRGTAVYRRSSEKEWARRRASVIRVLGIADVVMAPSRYLVDRFSERGARQVTVVENYIPSLFLDAKRPAHKGVTIGWVAAGEHQYDLEQLNVREVLQDLLTERHDVRVTTIGLDLGLKSPHYEHLRPVALVPTAGRADAPGNAANPAIRPTRRSLTSYTATFDIAIAPLVDAPFNRARSNVKLKEYAAGGSPWLASPIGPYIGMGEAQGGRLVEDDGWYEALTQLIDSSRQRRKLAKRAATWAAGETIEGNVHRWEAAFESAVQRARQAGLA